MRVKKEGFSTVNGILMTFEAYKGTLDHKLPPKNVNPLLQALWYDANGNWEKAHTIAQDIKGSNGDWVHAYLHRKEGDMWNADYWYRRAGKIRPEVTLEEEWEDICKTLLNIS